MPNRKLEIQRAVHGHRRLLNAVCAVCPMCAVCEVCAVYVVCAVCVVCAVQGWRNAFGGGGD